MAKRSPSRKPTRETRSTRPSPPANLLLAALPVADYERLSARMNIQPFRLKHVIHRSGDPVTHVYFPGGGFFSELTVLATGDMVEVATIGREGMAGWTAGFDAAPVPSVTMVQAEMDACYRLSVSDFTREMALGGAFQKLINRYRQALIGVIMQSTACNVAHTLEQRLARWFLMAQDRIGKDEFPLTQEFVAIMLGAARPTVSIVAGALQKIGVITYRRGRVRIVDRAGLEASACECYAVSAKLLRRVTTT